MNCPHLKDISYHASTAAVRLLSCKAGNMQYIPSIVELDVYCKHRRHTLCPFYLQVDEPRIDIQPDRKGS